MSDEFKPTDHGIGTQHIGLRLSDAWYLRVQELAAKQNLSLAEFCRQALMFAVEHMEGEDDELQ